MKAGDIPQENQHGLLHGSETQRILSGCLDDASGRPNAFSLTAH